MDLDDNHQEEQKEAECSYSSGAIVRSNRLFLPSSRLVSLSTVVKYLVDLKNI